MHLSIEAIGALEAKSHLWGKKMLQIAKTSPHVMVRGVGVSIIIDKCITCKHILLLCPNNFP